MYNIPCEKFHNFRTNAQDDGKCFRVKPFTITSPTKIFLMKCNRMTLFYLKIIHIYLYLQINRFYILMVGFGREN